MSHAGFAWSDEGPQAPPAAADSRFAWSDEGQKSPAPNAALAPVAGAPASIPVDADNGTMPGGKLQGLPGMHPHTPTFQEGKSDLMLASAPLAATMSVPRIIGSVIGGYAGDKGGRFLARTAGGGDTSQEIAGDVGGLIGGGIGAHRLNAGVRGFITPIADALKPEAVYPGAPRPASPSTGEFVESARATPPGPPISRGEVVQPKLLPESASVSRDLPYRMGPGEVAPEDVSAPDSNILARRQGIRIAPPTPQAPQRLLPAGSAGSMVESIASPRTARIASPGRIARPNISEIPEEEWQLGRYVESRQENTPREPLTSILRKSVNAARAQRIAKAGDYALPY